MVYCKIIAPLVSVSRLFMFVHGFSLSKILSEWRFQILFLIYVIVRGLLWVACWSKWRQGRRRSCSSTPRLCNRWHRYYTVTSSRQCYDIRLQQSVRRKCDNILIVKVLHKPRTCTECVVVAVGGRGSGQWVVRRFPRKWGRSCNQPHRSDELHNATSRFRSDIWLHVDNTCTHIRSYTMQMYRHFS